MRIVKVDKKQQIVFAEVYVAGVPDSHGDFMTLAELTKTAHRFLEVHRAGEANVEHEGDVIEASIVESFMNLEKSEHYMENAWVVGMHIRDPDVWDMVEKNELNGFSMEGLGKSKEDQELEIIIPEVVKGQTTVDEDHSHEFTVHFDSEGVLSGGSTDVVNGHRHVIKSGTVTDEAEGHSHKFSFIESFGPNE